MAECEENIPPYRPGIFNGVIHEVDPTGLSGSLDENLYIDTVIAFSEFFGITLCDEPEAHLLGQWVGTNTVLSVEHIDQLWGWQWPGTDDLYSFLTSYATLNGVQQNLSAFSSKERMEIVAKIRELAAIHSNPAELPPEPIEAQTGSGTIILGDVTTPFVCVPADARTFKFNCIAKASGYYHIVRRSSAPHFMYQRRKCGYREFSLRTDASYRARRPQADGLAWMPPRRAKTGFKWGCCILDAKYVYNTDTTVYQRASRYRQKLRQRTRVIVYPKARRWARRAAMARYHLVRGQETAQLGAYLGACASREIPYTKFLMICSEDVAREFFHRLMGRNVVGAACHSHRNSEHWRLPEDAITAP
ncbi:hypothetical protein [Yoonia sp. 2307UL14-13]|uniref:hypothetical protein n=1 Tax=Yoonia sp. 2307UL14-13 TaxID=3126506 RepID=UPI0030AEB34A